MSVLNRKQTAEAEAADTRGRMQQLARPTVLARAAVPMAKTVGLAARDGARNVATWTAPRIVVARTWTAPRIERSGLAIRDTIAPKICETLTATARRVDVTAVTAPRLDVPAPRPDVPAPRRSRVAAGTAILVTAAAAAAAVVVLRRRKNDGTCMAPGEPAEAGIQTGKAGEPPADGSGAEETISRPSPVT